MCKRCKTNQVSILYTTHTWALDCAILRGECYDGKINPVSTLQRALLSVLSEQIKSVRNASKGSLVSCAKIFISTCYHCISNLYTMHPKGPWWIVQKYKHMLSVQIKSVRNASKGTLVNCAITVLDWLTANPRDTQCNILQCNNSRWYSLLWGLHMLHC